MGKYRTTKTTTNKRTTTGAGSSSGGMFIIERVVGHRTRCKQLQVQVRWHNDPQLTWEPEETIRETAEMVLDAYFNRLTRSQKASIQKKTGRELLHNPDALEVDHVTNVQRDPDTGELKAMVVYVDYPRQPTWETAENAQFLQREKYAEYVSRLSAEDKRKLETGGQLSRKDDQMEADEYEVEKIVGLEVRDGKNMGLVKWLNYPESANSWEPIENLKGPSREAYQECYDRLSQDEKAQLGPGFEIGEAEDEAEEPEAMEDSEEPGPSSMAPTASCSLTVLLVDAQASSSSTDGADPDAPQQLAPDEFYVEKIVGLKKWDGRNWALIKWWDCPEDQNSWEPIEELMETAKEAYEEYYETLSKEDKEELGPDFAIGEAQVEAEEKSERPADLEDSGDSASISSASALALAPPSTRSSTSSEDHSGAPIASTSTGSSSSQLQARQRFMSSLYSNPQPLLPRLSGTPSSSSSQLLAPQPSSALSTSNLPIFEPTGPLPSYVLSVMDPSYSSSPGSSAPTPAPSANNTPSPSTRHLADFCAPTQDRPAADSVVELARESPEALGPAPAPMELDQRILAPMVPVRFQDHQAAVWQEEEEGEPYQLHEL